MTYEYTISQIDERLPGAELYVYSHWEEVQKLGGFKPELYVEVAHGRVTKDISSHAVCEMLYTEFNSGNPPEKLLRSFSVGDVVTLRYYDYSFREVTEKWFCDKIGFHRLE